MPIEILSTISRIEVIASGRAIRELDRLRRIYGPGRWRKLKGIALVHMGTGHPFQAEVHWYEAHGIGRKEFKVKRVLEG